MEVGWRAGIDTGESRGLGERGVEGVHAGVIHTCVGSLLGSNIDWNDND